MNVFDDYIQSRIDQVKRQMGATDVAFNLLGVTLTIHGMGLHIPAETIRAMSALMSQAETDAVDQLREELLRSQLPRETG